MRCLKDDFQRYKRDVTLVAIINNNYNYNKDNYNSITKDIFALMYFEYTYI